MATGNDSRFGVATETTFGTRVTPTRFFPYISEGISYQFNRVFVPSLGMGRWTRPSRTTTQQGSGPLVLPVTTTGMGYLLQLLHGNTVTPVQQAATAAYLQTHILDTAPTKSLTVQIQKPPVSSATLLPADFTGVVAGGLNLSWDVNQELRAEIPLVVQKLDTTQTLATYTPPTAWSFFTFQDGAIQIAGSPVAKIIGGGNVSFAMSLRDDAFELGTTGTIAKPIETDKPTVTGTFTADFEDLTHWNRVSGNTIADVKLTFTHPTQIAATYFPFFELTIKDCVFTSPFPTVDDPGPLQQTVTFSTASQSGNASQIRYQATDIVL